MKKSITIKTLLVLTTMTFVVSSCLNEFKEPANVTGKSIAQVASESDNFNILVAALGKTNLAGSLSNNNSGTFTVFAPSDAAFLTYYKSLSAAYSGFTTEAEVITSINSLTTSSTPTITALASVLNYHIVSSKIASDVVTGKQTFTTQNGNRLSISKSGSNVLLNANITSASINGANVTAVDTQASNGVIHTIDRVLTFSSTNASPIAVFGLAINYGVSPILVTGGSETGGDATGTDYDILAYAIRISGLATSLAPNISPLPDFTVFAPTDDAFRVYLGDVTTPATAVAENAAIQLIKALPATTLSDLLKYHVVSGRVLSTDLSNGLSITTLLTGKAFTVAISGPTFTLSDLNAAFDPTITSANVLPVAGVVHRIDAVLRPN
jgi:uncharacterized surface protein with fasciclin (FAS1) repeats